MAMGYEDTIKDVVVLPSQTQDREAVLKAVERLMLKMLSEGVQVFRKGRLVIDYEVRDPSESHPDELRVVAEGEWTGIFREFTVAKVPVRRAT